MFSFTPYSSAPYSALGETLVELRATLENFSLFSPPFSKTRFYSSYEFLGSSTVDLSTKLRNYNLSNFEAKVESSQSAIIKLNNFLNLNGLSNFENSSFIRLSELATLPNFSELSLEEKIQIYNIALLAAEAALNLLQPDKIQLESNILLKDVISFLGITSLKTRMASNINSVANFIPSSKQKNYNSAQDLNNKVVIQAIDRLFIPGQSSANIESELFATYLNRSTGNVNFDNKFETIVSSILKNYNLSDLDIKANLDLFAIVTSANNESLFTTNSTLNSSAKLKVYNNQSEFNSEVLFFKDYLSRTLGAFLGDIHGEIDLSPNYKTYASSILDSDIIFDVSSKIRFYNLSDMEIIGTVVANLSHRNRDIVYYILAIDRSKPFELQILRSK